MKKLVLIACILSSTLSWGQGCLAAHTNQSICSLAPQNSFSSQSHDFIHHLSVEIDWRNFSSFRHYIGTVEQTQRGVLGTQIKNHQNIYNIALNYDLSPRWSMNVSVPVLQGTRNQLYTPKGIYDIAGVGDIIVGAQAWAFRSPTESGGNIAFGAGLKLPSGLNNGTGTALLSNGTYGKAVADQSLQPGDGSWGFILSSQAYKQTYFHTVGYFQGSWLFNPRDTNGVPTFRAKPLEKYMSVTDQYLFRAGLARHVPRLRGLSASFGGRMEGIPVRDAFGSSNGFRRPGYIISLDPGLVFQRGRNTLMVSAPWAIQRNRRASVTDLATASHGDAAFADYAIVAGIAHHF
jgi:hypothetical protein